MATIAAPAPHKLAPYASSVVRAGPTVTRELPAGELGAHQPPEPQDFGVPRVKHRLDDVHRGVDGGLEIAGNAITQETASQRPPETFRGHGQQIGRLFMRVGFARAGAKTRIRPAAAPGRAREGTSRRGYLRLGTG